MRWVLAFLLLAGVCVADGRADEPTPVGTVFQDCSDCPDLVVLPTGESTIGASADDLALIPAPESRAFEQPRHRVSIHTFAMGRSAVTRSQFAAFVFETGYKANGCSTFDPTSAEYQEHPVIGWTEPGFIQGDRDPVVCVSYQDAVAYINWLTRKTRRPYRLPSEAEWEYAARAGTDSLRYWGGAEACRYANVADQSVVAAGLEGGAAVAFPCNDGHLHPAPIGSFQPNAFGLRDMLGNVAQWTADCVHPTYDGAPTDGSVWSGERDCARIIRGSGWMAGPSTTRAAQRSANPPTTRENGLGFRVAREIE